MTKKGVESLLIYSSVGGDRHSNDSSFFWTLLSATSTAAVCFYGWKEWQKRQKKKKHSRTLGSNHDLMLREEGAGLIPTTKKNKGPQCIYLDYNGTTPIHPAVLQAMMPYFTTHFGNPSSGHFYGKAPRQAMEVARRQILSLLVGEQAASSADPQSIWFTACGTESDNMAIQCALQAYRQTWQQRYESSTEEGFESIDDKKPIPLPHIVTSNIEHPAIEAYLQNLEKEKVCTVTYVPVQTDGRVKASDVMAACRKDGSTILVTLMWANNETGALQPVAEVSRYCRQHDILFHTDAAQAAGKVSVHLHDALGDADMVTLVGHKIGAPKGVACLYVRPGCLTEGPHRNLPDGQAILLYGGGQEFGRRAGTPNVPYIAGFGKAAADAAQHWPQRAKHMAAVCEYLFDQLQEKIGEKRLKRHGPYAAHERLPNTLSVGIAGIHSGQLLLAVADQVAASAGATCHSTEAVSSVLQAMKIPAVWARGTLRLSVGPGTSFGDVEKAATILARQVEVLSSDAMEGKK